MVDANIGRKRNQIETTGARLEVARRVFGVDPRLDRAAFRRRRLLRKKISLSGGQAQHPLDQIDAQHVFSDAVLHLQTGVDLQKVEALFPFVVDELDSAGIAIGDRFGQAPGGVVQFGAQRISQTRRRRFLDHLLIASLQRTIAFTKGQRSSQAIAKDLHFDVARHGDEFLQIDAVVAEVCAGQRAHAGEGRGQIGFGINGAHADAAAAGDAFEHHWIADPRRFRQRLIRIGQQSAAR